MSERKTRSNNIVKLDSDVTLKSYYTSPKLLSHDIMNLINKVPHKDLVKKHLVKMLKDENPVQRKKVKNPWLEHLKRFRKKNPHITSAIEMTKEAKKTYVT